MGVALLTPLLDKLGIPIAPQRVFTALLVLFSLMVLRDLYRQIKQSARRRAQAP
jgi:membrane protein implicated in regulation of membrane protease activity